MNTLVSSKIGLAFATSLLFMVVFIGCSSGTHSEDEESGTQYTKSETYDESRNGARFIVI